MKKFYLKVTVVVSIIMVIFACGINAHAARMTNLPITIVNNRPYGVQEVFTLTDIDTYDITMLDGDQLYKKELTLDIYGYFGSDINSDGNIDLALLAYNAEGTYLGRYEFNVDGDSLYDEGVYIDIVVPDVTAFFEIVAKNPDAVSNSYYYDKYENVFADDGRVMGVPELVVPLYENVGWHGPVILYSTDGRYIEVPYNEVEAYKRLGWTSFESAFKTFTDKNIIDYINQSDYNSAMEYVMSEIEYFAGYSVEPYLYQKKTEIMDEWRNVINCPLAICGYSVSDDLVSVNFRNISYKPIIALKIRFTSCDVFGNILNSHTTYYTDDCNMPTAEALGFRWNVDYGTKYIKNARVVQVVFSDYSTWNNYWNY